MNIEDMETMVARMAVDMKTLSHPMRAAAAPQRLGLVRRESMVTARRGGQSVYYSLARDDIRGVPGFLRQTYCRPAAVAA